MSFRAVLFGIAHISFYEGNAMYKTVSREASAQIVEKYSRFIASVKPVQTRDEAEAFIEAVAKKNRTANHNVYAYVLREDHFQKHSDDGEPGGTAGMPVLNVLLKQELTDVAVVVTRYFGGVLLGTGGLVRAYSAAAALGVEAAQPVIVRLFAKAKMRLGYERYGAVSAALAAEGAVCEDTRFTDCVEIFFRIAQEEFEPLAKKILSVTGGAVSAEKTGEEFLAEP